jgi:hypothetical protein
MSSCDKFFRSFQSKTWIIVNLYVVCLGFPTYYMLYYPLQRSWPKYAIALAACILIRVIPGRPPNVEPILATVMPMSRAFGLLDVALFAALNIVLYDAMLGQFGSWSIVGAATYAAIAAIGSIYLKYVRGIVGYLTYAVLGTVFFDLVTGVIVGPFMLKQSFAEAFVLQIPFTVNHVLGTFLMAVFLSPILERWVVKNRLLGVGVRETA